MNWQCCCHACHTILWCVFRFYLCCYSATHKISKKFFFGCSYCCDNEINHSSDLVCACVCLLACLPALVRACVCANWKHLVIFAHNTTTLAQWYCCCGTENHLGRSGRPKTTSMENGLAKWKSKLNYLLWILCVAARKWLSIHRTLSVPEAETAATDEIDTTFSVSRTFETSNVDMCLVCVCALSAVCNGKHFVVIAFPWKWPYFYTYMVETVNKNFDVVATLTTIQMALTHKVVRIHCWHC